MCGACAASSRGHPRPASSCAVGEQPPPLGLAPQRWHEDAEGLVLLWPCQHEIPFPGRCQAAPGWEGTALQPWRHRGQGGRRQLLKGEQPVGPCPAVHSKHVDVTAALQPEACPGAAGGALGGHFHPPASPQKGAEVALLSQQLGKPQSCSL